VGTYRSVVLFNVCTARSERSASGPHQFNAIEYTLINLCRCTRVCTCLRRGNHRVWKASNVSVACRQAICSFVNGDCG